MGVAISGLAAASILNEADIFEIETAGVSKKITKTLFRQNLFIDPAEVAPVSGDVLAHNGTDFVFIAGPSPPSRWTVINQIAYTEAAPATSSTITFAGGAPSGGFNRKGGDYFSVGLPVRVEIGAGVFYYGICTAVTDTLLTMSGAILPISPIISLTFGKLEMVKHVEMSVPAVTYNTLGPTIPLVKGCLHRWRGAPGRLVAYSCSHMNTSGTTVVNLKMNGGTNASTAGVIPAAGTATTHGAFVDSALGDLIQANLAIADNQTITAVVTTAGDTADFLVICMAFVLT